MIKSNYFAFAGGIVGYARKSFFPSCINAGIVDGGRHSVGGIVGYAGDSTYLSTCINTNKVDSVSAINFGAIVGEC